MPRKLDPRRRDFLKKAAYSAPAVLTLQAVSGLAKAGSEKPETLPKDTKPKKANKPKKAKKTK